MDYIRFFLSAASIVAGLTAFYWLRDTIAPVWTILMVVASSLIALGIAATTQRGKAALEFFQLARVELQKVVWPSSQETTRVTLIVLVLVIIIGLYLWLVDWLSVLLIYDILIGT